MNCMEPFSLFKTNPHPESFTTVKTCPRPSFWAGPMMVLLLLWFSSQDELKAFELITLLSASGSFNNSEQTKNLHPHQLSGRTLRHSFAVKPQKCSADNKTFPAFHYEDERMMIFTFWVNLYFNIQPESFKLKHDQQRFQQNLSQGS